MDLPSIDVCDDLIQAANAAHEKLLGYYDLQSDLAICATVVDPRLNFGYYNNRE